MYRLWLLTQDATECYKCLQIEMTAGSLSEWNALPRPPEDDMSVTNSYHLLHTDWCSAIFVWWHHDEIIICKPVSHGVCHGVKNLQDCYNLDTVLNMHHSHVFSQNVAIYYEFCLSACDRECNYLDRCITLMYSLIHTQCKGARLVFHCCAFSK